MHYNDKSVLKVSVYNSKNKIINIVRLNLQSKSI